MQKETIDTLKIRPEGIPIVVSTFGPGEGFSVVPADLIAATAGVNIGSARKVMLALSLLSSALDQETYALITPAYLPTVPPDDKRKAQTVACLTAILSNLDGYEDVLADELSLHQRVLNMRG